MDRTLAKGGSRMDAVTYALSKKYVNETLKGMGALKGAACTIKSIEELRDDKNKIIANKITFEWTDDTGTKFEKEMVVTNGRDGVGEPYQHNQTLPNNTWTINHGLNNQYPEVICFDDLGHPIEGDINYFSANVCIITFSEKLSGKAIIK